MAYKKFLVDNTGCQRRFHITYDDAEATLPRVELRCSFCNVVLFEAEDHPQVTLAREENLIKTSQLAELLVSDCHFTDALSQRTIPQYAAGKAAHEGPIASTNAGTKGSGKSSH